MRQILSSLKQAGLTEILERKIVGSGEELRFVLQLKGRHFQRPVEASCQMTFNHEEFSFITGHISFFFSFFPHALVPILILAQNFLSLGG